MSKRKQHHPEFKARVALEALKGEPHKVVLIVVARKLIVLANSLLAKNAVWNPEI